MRKRFLKFKERAITLKFKAFQYSWKESLRLLSVRSGAKSQKKFESISRLGYIDSQKHRISNHSRSSTPGGCLRLVPTKEVVEYVNKMLLDSRVKTYRNIQKMPTFILDKRERMGSRFISDNGLVEDPIDVEKQRAVVNLWTEEDRQMLLDNYALFGKNFKKIASFFQHKTVAECVEFYYKNHKSESFQKNKEEFKILRKGSRVMLILTVRIW
ncbi:putative transcription factor MYB/SANT family [Helianthus annuus]|nr:nuclear receptor corepressor 1-like [Helianthus annuus]KAJ0654978.1 putative transcription factor MYB/SANT family [Helianthus annuus]KAJ0658696.1 putative transcription factor MYB/SANT family [Helianthus annuus]